MSLRARLLLGMAIVAAVLVVASLAITRATEHNLIKQVDQQLERSQPDSRRGDYDEGPGERNGPPSALFVARFDPDTGRLDTLYVPVTAESTSPPDLTLGQAVGSGGHLRARCRCGRQGPLDTGYWLSRRWQARLLVDLEDRLRCACGERRVMLEAAVGPVAPGDMFLLAM